MLFSDPFDSGSVPNVLIAVLALIVMLPGSAASKETRPAHAKEGLVCGTSAQRDRDAIARGRYQASKRRGRVALLDAAGMPATKPALATSQDIGDIAVIENDGTIVVSRNIFDLANRAMAFIPADTGGFRVVNSTAPFDSAGDLLPALGDDDSRELNLGFDFSFFGRPFTTVFVNSDGNLTFAGSDSASTARDLGRFTSGPPRIGPLFADLDPSSGSVRIRREPDSITIIWDQVPLYGTQNSNSFSVRLSRSGAIEFVYSRIDSSSAVVGISPGANLGDITAMDYSTQLPAQEQTGTIAEVFAAEAGITETSVARRFLETHPDDFDQLIVFLAFPFSFSGAFAYELNVANDVQGIGLELSDSSEAFGSRGRLKSFVMMGSLDGAGRFPEDPTTRFFRTYNSLEILAHEVGHRWLAYSYLRLALADTDSLLWPTDLAHWSFFFNAGASVMEGNQIEDRGEALGSQRFVTVGATSRYSALDLYLMGIGGVDIVPQMYFVDRPTGTSRTPSSIPALGVVFGGTRRDFTIADIVAGNQERRPSVFQSPKVHRQAFILLTGRGQQASAGQVAKLQALRDSWVPYFNELTKGQSFVVTDLQPHPGNTARAILFPFYRGDDTAYTGIALTNTGTTPADVAFTAYGDDGLPVSLPPAAINPRVITLPPRAQIALLDSQILGIRTDERRSGWMMARSTSGEVTGFFLEGDLDQTYLDGSPADGPQASQLYFTRLQRLLDPASGLMPRDRLDVVNPGSTPAELHIGVIDSTGSVRATATRSLNSMGRLSVEFAELFPELATHPLAGYLSLSSDFPVTGVQYSHFDAGSTALPAQIVTSATRFYSAQFASGPAGGSRYFTDLNLVNTAAQRRRLEVSLVGNDGLLAGGITNPVVILLEGVAQQTIRGDTLFGLPDPILASVLTEGSLVIAADGPGILGDVTFGEPFERRFLASLPLDAAPRSDLVLAQVAQGNTRSGKPYFTGIALYNPNLSQVRVQVEVYSEQGERTGEADFVMPAGTRISRTLPEIVPGLIEQMRGYIRIHSAGGPIVGFELFGSQYLDFLAAVPPQLIIH